MKKKANGHSRRQWGMDYKIYHMTNGELVKCLCLGVVKIGMVSYLFYNSWWAFMCMLPYLFYSVKQEKKLLAHKRLEKLRMEFKEGIQALQAALDTGYSVENAFVEATRDLQLLYPEGSYIMDEFKRIVQGIRVSRTVEEMLDDFGSRSGLEEIQNFAEIFKIAKKSGGDLLLIIRSTVQTIREKLEVQSEIETMLSGKRFEQRIMNLIPFCILLYVKLSSGELLENMYGNITGISIMTGCLAVYMFAIYLAGRIINVEV